MYRNIVANIVGRCWSILSNFLFVPLYIQFLGIESYSIISLTLVIAGLMAEGETIIDNLHHIDRGYENFEQKFSNLGASIVRYEADEGISTDVYGEHLKGVNFNDSTKI